MIFRTCFERRSVWREYCSDSIESVGFLAGIDRSYSDRLTAADRQELDEYERIEHCVVMLKADV